MLLKLLACYGLPRVWRVSRVVSEGRLLFCRFLKVESFGGRRICTCLDPSLFR